MNSFTPVPYYCEENVWMLLRSDTLSRKRSFAVFITNQIKRVALFEQKNADREDVVIWDYHVVALELDGVDSKIWDFNTLLEIPCRANRWLDLTFRGGRIPEEYSPGFRLVPGEEYLSAFASDRSHMRAADGSYLQPPPPWPRIGSGPSNLDRYLDLEDAAFGTVHPFAEFGQMVSP